MPSVPQRYRGLSGPSGKLVSARLRPASGEVWLRLRPAGLDQLRKRVLRTVPLNSTQPPAPAPDALELRGGMHVTCHDGLVGRLEGVTIDTRQGTVIELLVRIRSDVAAVIPNPLAPLARLLAVSGQQLLLPPAWANSTKEDPSHMPLRPAELTLHLDASAEQVASGARLRRDGDIAADIWNMLDANPAIAPYTGSITVNVNDGEAVISGSVPTARHRASAEQDIWHIPGVFALRNDLRVQG